LKIYTLVHVLYISNQPRTLMGSTGHD
jgi:hypothetical protein